MPPDEQRRAQLSEFEMILAELRGLRAEVISLRERVMSRDVLSGPQLAGVSPVSEQLVSLDQIAAIVHRSKRSLERYQSQMPVPRVRGRRGQPHLWSWSEVRPWLEQVFNFQLPEHFPRTRR
jgi:hypothetical protein